MAGYQLFGRYRAGTDGLRVGGDWYDVVAIDDDDIALVIGDIVGHDLDAAIGMAQLRHALVGISHTRNDPSVVLDDVDHVAAQNPSLLASTLWYARLRPSTGRLVYASAGHHAPVVIDNGRITSLDGGLGPPIGTSSGTRGQSEAILRPGADLLAFTDGLIERRDESIDTSRERLITQLAEHHESPLGDIVDRLLQTIPDPTNADDIAMLALRYTKT